MLMVRILKCETSAMYVIEMCGKNANEEISEQEGLWDEQFM